MECDVPESCKLPSPDGCRKRFMWTHKGVDLAQHPVAGFVLQVGDAEKFAQVRRPGSLSQSASRAHVSQQKRRMEVTRDL